MEEPTALEKLTGNMFMQSGLAALAASVGTPLAALLPVLAETLAAGRHQTRVEKALARIEETLDAHRDRLNALTDPQYKLLNEIVLAVLQNTEDEKVEYLRRAIAAGLERSEINHTIAAQISRALRDMTAGELGFVVANVNRTIMIGPVSGGDEAGVKIVDRNSDEMLYVTGLLGLGILYPAGSTIDDSGKYVFPRFCESLRALIAL